MLKSILTQCSNMAQNPIVGRPRPPEASDYLRFPTRAGIALFVGVLAVCVYAEFGLWYVLPFAAWGFFSAWFILRQARSFDRQVEYSMNPIITVTEPPPPPVKIVEPVEVTPTTTGQELKYSGINLQDREWPIFAGMMLKFEKITFRDLNNLKLPSFDKLDKKLSSGQTKYAHLVNKLAEMGWVDSGGKLTEAGRAYFETKVQKRADSPTPLPAPVYVAASVHTSDNDKTTTR